MDERLNRIQALEAMGILVAGVAHNLNNVLAVILGTTSLHNQATTESSALEDFRIIASACGHGRSVIRSLLQFAQPRLASRAPLDLHTLIREVRVLLENTTRNKIAIITTFVEGSLWIDGDAGNISHALMNLCLNALDAMPDGGTLVLGTAAPAPDEAEVSVQDDGAGMAPEILARVLEPFFTTKEVGKGTGLGLSMTYGVVKAHGGTLDIASRPGQGTCVKMRFPRIPPPAPGEGVEIPNPTLKSLNVLLVDDDEDVRFLMTRLLTKAGAVQVKTAARGEEALEILRSQALPDLVILDQNMPGLNGVETMGRIRSRYPDLPILISSGQPDIENWSEFRQHRVGVIPKPFTLEEIQAKLAQLAHASRPGHP
jgi:CheY-like chemotaxis protein